MNHKIVTLFSCIILFVGLSHNTFASEPWPSQQSSKQLSLTPELESNNIAQKIQLATQVEFLAVEDAYQVAVNTDADTGLRLNWTIADGYYLYQHKFKFTAYAQDQMVKLETAYPTGRTIYDPTFEQELEVYYQQLSLLLHGASSNAPFKLKIEFQGCADAGLCYAPAEYWFNVEPSQNRVSTTTPPQDVKLTSASREQSSLLLALFSALLGGLILNLMPCVFPVLSLKALSLAETHQHSHRRHLHGWSYTAGAVFSFVAIASLMLGLKAAGQAIGWGFQLQSPIFVSLLAYLFFAMGLSLSGFAEFGGQLMGIGNNLSMKSGYQGSFYTGVLASVVASPCTAPFMGTALGYALGQPAAIALLVFATLGLGMALPFLLLSYLPNLGRQLPRPGAWMDTLKQALAFPLYLAAIWLIWVLGRQSGSDAVAIVLSGSLLIVFALWLQKKYQHPLLKLMAAGFIFAALVLAGMIEPTTKNAPIADGKWQSYSDKKVSAAIAGGRSVFINATADWCLTCLANERLAFTDKFYQQLEAQNTLALKADWTNYNPQITALLSRHGRSGVPLYVFINNSQASILPQLLTESNLIKLSSSLNSLK